MSRLWLIGLAASAAWTPAAMAKGAPPAPPPPPMPHGAHAPMAGPGVMHGGGHRIVVPRMHGGGHMGGMKGHMKGWQRFGRGHVVPHHFRGRQFFVHNWQTFGWPAPMPGGNWIRYYDDALLIDRDGRVIDGRYGWDWDRGGGGHGGYDEDRYEDDYADEGADYDLGRDHHGDGGHDRGEWDEDRRDGRHHGDRVVRAYPHDGATAGDCRRSCTRVRHLPPPPPGYGHGYGYGYGYGYGAGCACGPVVITETTTTTAPVVETRTYYETVYEHRAAPRRHYKKPVVRHHKPVRRSVKAAPAPRPGERG